MHFQHQIRKLGLLGLGIFLVSCASCNQTFDWEPRPFVGNSIDQNIINAEGNVVACIEPRFDTYTCFDSQNIAELRTAIGEVESKETRNKLYNALKGLDKDVWRAKNKINR